jgi:hypothetical protein
MLRNTSIAILAVSLLTAATPAQTVLDEFMGNQHLEQVGFSVAGGADFDGDGWDDLVIGSPFRDAGSGNNNGAVKVISGQDGSQIHLKIGDNDHDWFGWDVALAGDVNGDGVQDVIVGAPKAEQGGVNPGMARVFSGATSATLYTVYGDADGDLFGLSVSGGLDHDGDGRAEFVVGAPNADYTGLGIRGAVRVFDGATGAQVNQTTSVYPDAQWGTAVWAKSDVDGDGTKDIVVGAPNGGFSNQGQVKAFSGATFLTIGEWIGTVSGDRFGAAVGGGIDLTGDGNREVLVGAPREGTNGVDAGWVGLFDGATFALVHEWYGDAAGDDFGTTVAVLADVDGDNVRDVVVGAPQATSLANGYARVFTSVPGTEAYTVVGDEPGAMFGHDVAHVRDFNNDGAKDFAVGTRLSEAPSGFLTGSARVYSGSGAGFVNYCTSGTSANGCQALISGTGTPSASAATGFTLSATNVEGSKNGIFFYGASGRQANSWGNGSSYQCVVPPVKRGGLLPGSGTGGACDGSFLQDLNARWCPSCPKPTHNFGAGAIVQAQLWHRDPMNTSNQTTTLSNALEFVVSP